MKAEIKNIFKLLWCCGSVLITEVTAINVALKKLLRSTIEPCYKKCYQKFDL